MQKKVGKLIAVQGLAKFRKVWYNTKGVTYHLLDMGFDSLAFGTSRGF